MRGLKQIKTNKLNVFKKPKNDIFDLSWQNERRLQWKTSQNIDLSKSRLVKRLYIFKHVHKNTV